MRGTRSRDLVSKCGFGVELEIIIRDIFVVEMWYRRIQNRSLEEVASIQSIEVGSNQQGEATINASKQ